MDYGDLVKLVKTRRSIRNFKTDSIPDEDVDRIIEVARWAPSGANSQPWEFIVLKDKAIKDRIVEIVKEYGECGRKVELTRAADLQFPGATGPVREPGYKDAPVFIIIPSLATGSTVLLSLRILSLTSLTWSLPPHEG